MHRLCLGRLSKEFGFGIAKERTWYSRMLYSIKKVFFDSLVEHFEIQNKQELKVCQSALVVRKLIIINLVLICSKLINYYNQFAPFPYRMLNDIYTSLYLFC